ncbi:MAG: ABC transporter substrate-binding protein [Halobacteriaceae archaeon]
MPQRIPRRTVLGMGAAGLAGLAGCSGDGGDSGPNNSTEQGTPTLTESPKGFQINVGMIRPTQGNLSALGDAMKKTRDFTVEHIDAIPTSHTLNMPVKDTDGTPEDAVRAAQELVDEGFPAIVGPASDEATKAVIDVLTENKVMGISPFCASVDVLNMDDHVKHKNFDEPTQMLYSIAPTTDGLGTGFAQPLALARVGDAAILYEDNLYGNGVVSGLKTAFEPRQLSLTGEHALPLSADSYTSQIEAAVGNDPGVLVLAASPGVGKQVLSEYYADFGDTPVAMVDRLHMRSMPDQVSSDVAGDIAVAPTTVWMEEGRGTPTASEGGPSMRAPFPQAWKYFFDGEKPTLHSAYVNEAIMVPFLCAVSAGEDYQTGVYLSRAIRDVINPQDDAPVLPAGVHFDTFFQRDFKNNPFLLKIQGSINNWNGVTGNTDFAMSTGTMAARTTPWEFAPDAPYGFRRFDAFKGFDS